MIALLLAIGTSATAIHFAPPLDRPYRVILHQERTQAGVTRRYEIERRLVFHRNADGLIADMTLVRIWQDAGGDSGRRFEAAVGALKGRTLRFHLADDGSVTAIDDEAAIWAAAMAEVAQAATPAGKATARKPTSMVGEIAPYRRRTILASPLASLISGTDGVAGSGPVSISSGLAADRVLRGTRTVTVDAGTRLHIAVHAQAGDDAAPLTLDRDRLIDRATGLVVEEQSTQSMGGGRDVQIIRQRVSVDPVS